MPWVKSFKGFLDFLSGVIIHAPDGFPKEDFLRDDEQLTLDKAFEELNGGMRFVADKVKDEAVVAKLRSTLDASHAAYRQGDDIRGAHLLQEFEQTLLKHTRVVNL